MDIERKTEKQTYVWADKQTDGRLDRQADSPRVRQTYYLTVVNVDIPQWYVTMIYHNDIPQYNTHNRESRLEEEAKEKDIIVGMVSVTRKEIMDMEEVWQYYLKNPY